MGDIHITKHARMRWHERHGHASGWNALSSVEELARDAWLKGETQMRQPWASKGEIVRHYGGCEFVFAVTAEQTVVLVTFYPPR